MKQNIFKRFMNMKESGIIIVTILYIIMVQIINPVFLSVGNILNVLRSTGFTLITAIGMTLALVSGGLDLSVGSVLALGGVMTGLAINWGCGVFLAVIIGIISGVILGWINGILIVRFNIPPMIMTLGMMYIARGIVNILTLGVPVYPLPEAFMAIEQQDLLGIPKVIYISLLLAAAFAFILKHMTFGRRIYAIGGNCETARISGIDIGKTKVYIYMIVGGTAALTGILQASRLGSAQPGAGADYSMNVIAACIIGGTSTYGGVGTVLGTVIGSFFMNMMTNSMQLMRISVYWQNLVIGVVLVLAVILDEVSRARKAKHIVEQ